MVPRLSDAVSHGAVYNEPVGVTVLGGIAARPVMGGGEGLALGANMCGAVALPPAWGCGCSG